MLRYACCIPNISRTFVKNRCWILSKAFSSVNEMIRWCLYFILITWWIAYIDLWMLKHFGITCMKPSRSWWMIFLRCSWIQLSIFENIVFMFIREMCLQFFFVVFLCSLVIMVTGLIGRIGQCSSCFKCGE